MARTEIAPAAEQHDEHRPPMPVLLVAALIYTGLAASIPRRVNFAVGTFFAGLLVASVIALVGWTKMRRLPSLRSYLGWSIAAAVWILIAGLAAWSRHSLYEGAKVSVWLAFIIPGLGAVMSDHRYRHFLLLGWLGGVSMYAIGAGSRVARGLPVLDVLVNSNAQKLFGVNRNAVNILVLFIVPFLLAGVGNRLMRIARWPILALSILWLVESAGRTALAGLVLVGLIYAISQPTASRRLVFVLGGVLMLIVVAMLVQSAGGQATQSTNRLVQFFNGQRDDPDEARVLLAKKSWNLAVANPAFGVGSGNFKSVNDAAALDANDAHVAQIVRTQDEHDTYLQVLAEDGFPGAIAFLATIFAIFLALWRSHRSREVCATIAALGGTVFSVTFHAALGTALYVPMAIAVGMAFEATGRTAVEPEPEHQRFLLS